MMKNRVILIVAVLVAAVSCSHKVSPVMYVNTLQGTASDKHLSYGNTYPATMMPRGTHAWSPRTALAGANEKYVWMDSLMRGFDLTHQCNIWLKDYGILTMMPETGQPVFDEEQRAAVFHHENETGLPHYYKVTFDNGITTEIAPTERCAHIRFTFPASDKDAVLVLDGGLEGYSYEISDSIPQISGWVQNLYWYIDPENPAKKNLKCHFLMTFDNPFTESGTDGRYAYVKFAPGSTVTLKMACSFISQGQAKVTYDREIAADRTFEETKARGEKVWNDRLSSMTPSGGSEEDLRTFYTCLYRASCFPRMFYEYDASGNPVCFSPYDGKIHEGRMFADCGLWDAYHSLMPLYCLIDRENQGQYVKSMLDAYDQWGWLPAWSSPEESGMMTGNHAISVLADAWAKGIHTFDPGKAIEAYWHDSMHEGPYLDAVGRGEWEDYNNLGFIPEKDGRSCATSKTLEYAYDDWCAWNLCQMSGYHAHEEVFARNAASWKNVFDSASGFMRGKNPDGSWVEPFDPLAWDGYFAFESRTFCEGNAWHWTWAVNHDVEGLIEAFGGRERFIEKLDSVFEQPVTKPYGRWAELKDNDMMDMNMEPMGQYAHGNEPIHHLPYLYDIAGEPWKTQKWARKIMTGLYSSGPKGYPGDEDQGAMSAWYVLSAAGLYCVTPGSDRYWIGSPLFEKMEIAVDGGKFTIEAKENSKENIYIQSATLDGKPLDRCWISHDEIKAGSVLHLDMGSQPSRSCTTL